MKDVSRKFNSLRTACAEAVLRLAPATLTLIRDGKVPKGDPLPVAKVAAIQAAKETSRIIPYCHPVPVDFVGVEMEALTGASVAALTLYDMLKMLDTSLEITSVRLLDKHGGKSDFDQTQAALARFHTFSCLLSFCLSTFFQLGNRTRGE